VEHVQLAQSLYFRPIRNFGLQMQTPYNIS
jgi:hypothetical protein